MSLVGDTCLKVDAIGGSVNAININGVVAINIDGVFAININDVGHKGCLLLSRKVNEMDFAAIRRAITVVEDKLRESPDFVGVQDIVRMAMSTGVVPDCKFHIKIRMPCDVLQWGP